MVIGVKWLAGAALGIGVLGLTWSPRAVGQRASPDVVVYAADLTEGALSEFDFWSDSASPGGKVIGTVNKGDGLDPPPESDPHVTFKMTVQGGVSYRCWIHMKVGTAKGKSTANKFWVQFSNAVDRTGAEAYKPGTSSYLTAQGPARPGWAWVSCDDAGAATRIAFRASGLVTVRLQAGMEGVGFDQLLLSSAKFLETAPTEAVVPKAR